MTSTYVQYVSLEIWCYFQSIEFAFNLSVFKPFTDKQTSNKCIVS